MRDSYQQRDIKDAILDATDRLLAQNGYKKMTIDDLAHEVGIGKGSIYLHFSSKEEIALSHIDRIIERLKKNLFAISERPTACEKRLHEMLMERVLFRFDSIQHYSQSLNEILAHLRPKLLDRRKRYFQEEARIFERVLEEGIRSGDFAAFDPNETAKTLLTATNSLLPYSLSTHELGERGEISRKTDNLANLLLSGLMNRGNR